MKVGWSDHALEVVDGLFDTTDRLGELPEMGPPYPPAGDPNVRFILFKTYRIVYSIEQERVVISSVRHTRRDAGQEEG